MRMSIALQHIFISIHALREESDDYIQQPDENIYEFLSTPSARRATHPVLQVSGRSMYFYPRPPRGERHFSICPSAYFFAISIHALREESDRLFRIDALLSALFLSTPSARRATGIARNHFVTVD